MRRLPDGVYHCPACGSEVLPTETAMKLVQDTAYSISVRVSD
jgi:hypothetical protein